MGTETEMLGGGGELVARFQPARPLLFLSFPFPSLFFMRAFLGTVKTSGRQWQWWGGR